MSSLDQRRTDFKALLEAHYALPGPPRIATPAIINVGVDLYLHGLCDEFAAAMIEKLGNKCSAVDLTVNEKGFDLAVHTLVQVHGRLVDVTGWTTLDELAARYENKDKDPPRGGSKLHPLPVTENITRMNSICEERRRLALAFARRLPSEPFRTWFRRPEPIEALLALAKAAADLDSYSSSGSNK